MLERVTHGDARRIGVEGDEHGTRDLMVLERGSGEVRRLSGILGGADAVTLARQGGRLVLAAYSKGGWDLRLVEDAVTSETLRRQLRDRD